MFIIDRNKDFYDYLSHVYGEDKNIIFNRSNSIRLTDEDLFNLASKPIRNNDIKMYYFLLLEVGYVQYLIKLYDIKSKKNKYGENKFLKCKFEISKTYNKQRNLFNTPLSISSVKIKGRYRRVSSKRFEWLPVIPMYYELLDSIGKTTETIKLPILDGTSLTGILKQFEIWKELNTYLSSLDNDKDVSINMSDVSKAETHGFDKYSFRHPIK